MSETHSTAPGQKRLRDSPSCFVRFSLDFMSSTQGWPLVAKAVDRERIDASWHRHGFANDPETLRRLRGANKAERRTAWPFVRHEFAVDEHGLLRNGRLERERTEANERHEEAKAAEYLGRDRRTLEAWERRGTGPVVIRLPSGLPGYLRADLDAFIDMHRVMPAQTDPSAESVGRTA